MREIKFRVWDKELNQMLHTTDLEWYDDSFGFRLEKHIEDIEYNLMQYIGLKDSNGKEIYEGDIVEIEDYFGEDIIGRVIYDETCSCYWFMKGDERNHFKTTFDLEGYVHTVIGNIYENPKLLSETR